MFGVGDAEQDQKNVTDPAVNGEEPPPPLRSSHQLPSFSSSLTTLTILTMNTSA